MEEKTLTFSISGDFITNLARERLYCDHDLKTAIELLESATVTDSISETERFGLIMEILDGKKAITGTYPGSDYGIVDIPKDKRSKTTNLQAIWDKLSRTAKENKERADACEMRLNFLRSGLPGRDIRRLNKAFQDEFGEPLFEDAEDDGSELLYEYMSRMDRENDPDRPDPKDDYGWLFPDGTFYPVPWGDHLSWADNWLDQHEPDWYDSCPSGMGTDYLSEHYNAILMHNPQKGIGRPTMINARVTKAQKEFIYQYYIDRNENKIANDFWEAYGEE